MAVHIHTWNDLQRYGINSLTGEACSYSQRLLCDLNEKGVDLVREYFGLMIVLNPQAQFARNWNTQVNGAPAIASIMLPRSLFGDLAKFILFHVEKCDMACWRRDNGWNGYMMDELPPEMTDERMRTLFPDGVYRNPMSVAERGAGSRNRHQFTGRTE